LNPLQKAKTHHCRLFLCPCWHINWHINWHNGVTLYHLIYPKICFLKKK
jgi:hypothetical protein